MRERRRPDREVFSGGSPPNGVFDQPETSITVSSGPYRERLPVGNRSVGEIRRVLNDRLDLDPQSQAVLDGVDVSDEVVVRPGQSLRFVRRAGEKGAPDLDDEHAALLEQLMHRAGRRTRQQIVDTSRVAIEGTEAIATSPEGKTARMPLDRLLGKIGPQSLGTGEVILPDGVKAVVGDGAVTIWIHESAPDIHRLVWIAPDSPVPYGHGAKYREVRLALPYLVIFCIFQPGPGGVPVLSQANEAFFRNEPLKSFEDELYYPALLNCSKFDPPDGRPLSWICTQYIGRDSFRPIANPAERFSKGFAALKHCLLETGFNYSSERHEASSWFTESRKVDPRLDTVEAWEAASSKDPLFALEVPWLPTGHTLRQAVERTLNNFPSSARRRQTAGTMARVIFNSASQTESKKTEQLTLHTLQ